MSNHLDDVSKRAVGLLDDLELSIEKNVEPLEELRRKADDVYASRVAALAKAHGVSNIQAHALAMKDDVGSRAYELSTELAKRQAHFAEGGRRAATYLE